MLQRRKAGLERIANWGVALAVPLVAIGGFLLLAHARDGARPVPGQPPPAATAHLYAPPIDASAPPVVDLRPSPAPTPAAVSGAAPTVGDPVRCAALVRETGRLDAAAGHATAADAARLRERAAATRAEARSLHCPSASAPRAD
jgi:hypothetical protein